jgi:hypothetical protein
VSTTGEHLLQTDCLAGCAHHDPIDIPVEIRKGTRRECKRRSQFDLEGKILTIRLAEWVVSE